MTSGKDKDKPNRGDFDFSGRQQSIIDATPGNGRVDHVDVEPNSDKQPLPRSAAGQAGDQGRGWQSANSPLKGLGNAVAPFWAKYMELLRTSFQRMNRTEQVQLIVKAAIVVSVGLSAVGLEFFYYFLPLFVRVIAAPLVVVLSWWFGARIVAPMMITRFEHYLNKE